MNNFALFQLSRAICFTFFVLLSFVAGRVFMKLPVKRKLSKIIVEILLVFVVFAFALTFKVCF